MRFELGENSLSLMERKKRMVKKSVNKWQDSIFDKDDFNGKDVLEVGSGRGSFTLEFLMDARSIFGIDTSNDAVEFMKNNWPGTQETSRVLFQEGNIVDIPLDGKEFDRVVFSNSF